ncbi:MAG: radical SAM protein [Syntrophomonadaceae bacterium]|nr:radical SAM protein [Syntrophomonadaceae bacterium]
MFRCLYANAEGELLDHPGLTMLGRSGMDWVEPEAAEMIPLPQGASLVSIPGRAPAGVDEGGCAALAADPFIPDREATAVAALLPQGFTRTLYPAYTSMDRAIALPLLGYAAIGLKNERIYVAAVQTDAHRQWHPRYFNTEGLPRRVDKLKRRMPDNGIVRQLAHCSLQYGCFTAQNIFYGRWEGGIPVSRSCNADCIGCISEDHPEVAAPQQRLKTAPTADEVAELGLWHLQNARDPIISFGQGCEGEPALQAPLLAAAIRRIRERCDRGTINMNTNAGYTKGIKALCDAGIDSLRISMFSAREQYYDYYHRPRDYGLNDVKHSLDYARRRGIKLALNLLLFPGFQDRPAETAALIKLMRDHDIGMLQLRNLNIDPDRLFAGIDNDEAAQGVTTFLCAVQEALPEVEIGNYSRPAPLREGKAPHHPQAKEEL